MSSFLSKEDHVARLSKSIFVTNFPDNFRSRDLWKLCEAYGKVVDVYIPNYKSKAGKRYNFVRFIKVEDVDRLVGNLCTLWVGRFHLHANVVRFERPDFNSKPATYSKSAGYPQPKGYSSPGSFMNVVKGNPSFASYTSFPDSPSLVLDNSCVNNQDLSRHVMGKVKDISSIPNLCTLFTKEGFSETNLSYLGGLWVMIELVNESTRNKLLLHSGVKSWFHVIQLATHDFVTDERVVWVDIEVVPLNLWSRDTFLKIGKKWGESLDIEENIVSSFARKRLRIKTNRSDNILEKFKITHRGKVYLARAKELFAWTPIFLDCKVSDDVEGVSDTIFDDNLASPFNSVCQSSEKVDDPIGEGIDTSFVKESSPSVHSKVMNNSEEVHVKEVSKGNSEFRHSHNHKSGSILEVLDDMVRVGQSMRYDMDGLGHKTKKEWVKELNLQHKVKFLALQEMKMDRITHMDVKFIWGNSNYQFVSSDSVGNSGGILCIWEATVFKKAYITIFDNFIAIYGNWISNNSKVLIVVVYAPQSLALKRALWEYISSLISRWDGESIVMGDFNDVRSIEERLGSVFNHSSARDFNRFIEASGLVDRNGFDAMVEHAWNSFSHSDSNRLIRLKKKLQDLKVIIRRWIKDKDLFHVGAAKSIKQNLTNIDKNLDRGNVSDELLLKRMDFTRQLLEFKQMEAKDWTDPEVVKDAFKDHFANRFNQPGQGRFKLNFLFPNRLSNNQVADLDRCISHDEIRGAVWNCGVNKSPGPDGLTFEFFRRYWSFIGPDFCSAIDCFFESGNFPMGNNASFIALIPKVTDAKFVTDFRPISLIGCVYKVVTKILANRLATVITDLVSDTQSAFVSNRQILDGPFILNELIAWCKRKKKQAMIFKVDFAKEYDSVRWDYLLDVLHAFEFGPNWCKWIRGTFSSSMASVFVNGNPSSEFPFFCGLKQADPLAPYLFILIKEYLHISFSRATSASVFNGIRINDSTVISHLFYVDDAIFMGEWSDSNMANMVKILRCFFLASGLKINIQKSQILGVGVHRNHVSQAALHIGCTVMQTPFWHPGVMVGDCMARKSAWSDIVHKLHHRLSKWKVKTLSIGGRLMICV
nr:RNA-directed DNA polymerase, eukaryota [Tanacetum cinerariifolium]